MKKSACIGAYLRLLFSAVRTSDQTVMYYTAAMARWAHLTPAILNALGMMALITGCVFVLIVLPRQKPTRRRISSALLLGGLYVLLGSTFTVHLCDAGNPMLQWVVAGLFLAAILSLLRSRLRWVIAILIAVIGAALAEHATTAAHNGYPLNPHAGRRIEQAVRQHVAHLLQSSGKPSLPAGPIPSELLPDSTFFNAAGQYLRKHIRLR